MANSRSWWVCWDRAWPPLTVNSRSLFWASNPRRGQAELWQVRQEVSNKRMWHLVFCISFYKSRCFIFWRHVVPWEVACRFELAPLMLVQHAPHHYGKRHTALPRSWLLVQNFEKRFDPNRWSCLQAPYCWLVLNVIQRSRFNYPWVYKRGDFSLFFTFLLFALLQTPSLFSTS